MGFNRKDIKQVSENIFSMLDNEWMLLTAGTLEKMNTMTISWGSMGILWNKPIAICFVRPQRYTDTFMKEQYTFTLTVLPPDLKHILTICGSKSGRNTDKIRETGLTPFLTPGKGISFEQARIYVECKKTYTSVFDPANIVDRSIPSSIYPGNDFHNIYFGEITGWFEKAD